MFLGLRKAMSTYRIDADDFASFDLAAEHVAVLAIKSRDLKEAAKDVHNWARRELITFRPKTEEVRQPRFSFASVIEVAVIGELTRAGYGVQQSAQIAQLAVDRAKQLATLPDAEDGEKSKLQTLGFTYDQYVMVFSFRPNGAIDHNFYTKDQALGRLFPELGSIYSPFNKHVFQVDYLLFKVTERYCHLVSERASDPAYFDTLKGGSE